MSESQPGGDPARMPAHRVEPRLDWAGEAAAFYRGRVQDTETALSAANAARVEAERKLAAAEAAARTGNERLMRAGLKAHAVSAGIVDTDVLKLLDPKESGVRLDEEGDVVGAKEAIEALKAAKPWAFKNTAADKGSSSSTASPPGVPAVTGKRALDMTEAEWRAERARLIRF